MGGNGSFSKITGKELTNAYTHIEYGERIMSHKILVQESDISHNKTPMNSHSPNSTYICGKVDKTTGIIQIETIAKYKNHKLVETIDIKTDKDGNLITYTTDENGSHSHKWFVDSSGRIGRKSHKKNNTFPIDESDMVLIKKVMEFNKQNKRWKEGK